MLAKILKILLAVTLAVTMIPEANSQAQPYRVCLAKALLKSEPGKKIEILDHDGNSISGRLEAIDLEKYTIIISRAVVKRGRLVPQSLTVSGKDISEIKFRKTGKFDTKYMVVGLGVGAGIGWIVGGLIGKSKESSLPLDFTALECSLWGIGIGAGTGLLLGAILPPLILTNYESIECGP